MPRIALLGTGLLGSGMVRHFLKGDTQVTVWNRTEAKARELEAAGAQVATTPEAAVAGVDRVHIVLPDDAIVDGILDRIAPALKKGAIVVDHSTTLPAGTTKRFERIRATGIRFLHAPVFMSPQMAAAERAVYRLRPEGGSGYRGRVAGQLTIRVSGCCPEDCTGMTARNRPSGARS